MGSLHSGSNVKTLLEISTEDFHLTIKGNPHNDLANYFYNNQPSSNDYLAAKIDISPGYQWARVYHPHAPEEWVEYKGNLYPPLFYEQTTYEIIIERKGSSSKMLTLDHLNPRIKDTVTHVGSEGHLLSGPVNFKDEVGFSRFQILGDNVLLLSFEVEVFPTKLDYQKDFWQLLDEVNLEVYNLAFDFLMKTHFPAALTPQQKPSPAEFFYIIDALFQGLKRALERIESKPHHKIVAVNRIVAPEKAKRVDARTVSWLSSRSYLFHQASVGITVGGKKYLPRKVLDSKKELTYDTYENRFIKWMVHQLERKLKFFSEKCRKRGTAAGGEGVAERAEQIRSYLRRYGSKPFLKEVNSFSRMEPSSLVLQMAPGYREAFKYYLMIIKGLHVHSDLFTLSLKNMAELYEYWCFLKIHQLLRKKYQLESSDMISVDRSGLTVNLKKGQESKVRYKDELTGENITLVYNRTFTRLPTLAQRPDNILELEKVGSQRRYFYVIDAKYRLNTDPEYVQAFGQPGPPEDTINTMHRYRDAIVSELGGKDGFKRYIFGAFVLFPHNDEMSYAGRKDGPTSSFYKSIDRVGIGALPFLPSQTALVEEFLDELIWEPSLSVYERTVLQEGIIEHLEEQRLPKNVLVGPLRHKEQLQVCLENNMYYTYLAEVKSYLGSVEYVAMYQPKKKYREEEGQGICYYGKVKKYDILPRQNIKEIPVKRRNDELVVKFFVDKWEKKDPKIVPGGYGPVSPQRTSWKQFELARVYPELHLGEGEVLLWRELKRFRECTKVTFPSKNIATGDRLELMEFPGLVIYNLDNEKFMVQVNGYERTYQFLTLQQQPGKILREIVGFWRGQLQKLSI